MERRKDRRCCHCSFGLVRADVYPKQADSLYLPLFLYHFLGEGIMIHSREEGSWRQAAQSACALILLVVLSGTLYASASAQTAALIVNAVDDDPENGLWDCDTRRVPFRMPRSML
jgi:hypothetical protein